MPSLGDLAPGERAASNFSSRQLPAPPREPAPEWMRYARMLKPFPVRQLSDALYYVQTDGIIITQILTHSQIDPPSMAEPWAETLFHLITLLESLEARCRDAIPVLEGMVDRADADAARAITAMAAILKGIASEPPPDAGEAPALRAA